MMKARYSDDKYCHPRKLTEVIFDTMPGGSKIRKFTRAVLASKKKARTRQSGADSNNVENRRSCPDFEEPCDVPENVIATQSSERESVSRVGGIPGSQAHVPAQSESCGCASSEKVIALLKKNIILLEGAVESLRKELEKYQKEESRKTKKKTVADVVDMFHELNCTNSTLFPEQEDIIRALKEEWGIPEKEDSKEVDPAFLNIEKIIKGRKNKRGSYVREALKDWKKSNPSSCPSSEDILDKPKWHKENGVPFSKKMVADVVKGTWNTYIEEPGIFTIPQIAFTVAEIEKVITGKSTTTREGQNFFKRRYKQLCQELTDYISDLKALEEEGSEITEYEIGEMIVWIDEDDFSVVDMIRQKKALPKTSEH